MKARVDNAASADWAVLAKTDETVADAEPAHTSAGISAQDNLAFMAVARRKWAGHLGASWAKLARVKKSGDSARIVEAANDCLSLYSSEQRLEKLIHAVADQPPEVFWPVWLNTWSVVDRVADLQPYLPALFKRKGPAHQFFDDGMRAMLEALPGVVTVYRGCDRRFIEGIAWTTDYAVAEYFARGGRYGRPRDPVIATGKIAKASADLFYVVVERNEAEIVCKPTIVEVEVFTKLDWPAHRTLKTLETQF